MKKFVLFKALHLGKPVTAAVGQLRHCGIRVKNTGGDVDHLMLYSTSNTNVPVTKGKCFPCFIQEHGLGKQTITKNESSAFLEISQY